MFCISSHIQLKYIFDAQTLSCNIKTLKSNKKKELIHKIRQELQQFPLTKGNKMIDCEKRLIKLDEDTKENERKREVEKKLPCGFKRKTLDFN